MIQRTAPSAGSRLFPSHILLTSLLLAVFFVPPSARGQTQSPPPDFSLSLSPETIAIGNCTEATFTIENTSPNQVNLLAFTLNLPPGVTLATPANPITDCGGILSAPDGGSTISLSNGQVPANTTCTISVALTISAAGPFELSTSLTSSGGVSGPATMTLGTPAGAPVLGFTKRFFPELVPLGGRSTLTYTIENQSAAEARMLSFTDNLPPGISMADPPNVTVTCAGGEVTAVAGTQTISYREILTTPALPAGESCTISVDVVGVSPGRNISMSGDLTAGSIGGGPVSSGRACAELEVIPPDRVADLTFTKSFPDSPIAPGATGTLSFTITNNSLTESAFDLSFTDDLTAVLPGLVATSVPTEGGLILAAPFGSTGSPNLIGGTWDYLDRIENELGANQGYPEDGDGDQWNSPDFDVATSEVGPWSSGAAPLQAGEIDAFPPGTPQLLFGVDAAPDGTSNLITTYLFRHQFDLTADQLTIDDWQLDYLFDDGAIVYVNGIEVFRTPNMPAGIVNTNTLADLGVESTFASAPVDLAGLLVQGRNTLAVEVHQTALDSSDVGFSLELVPASESSTSGFTYADDTFGTDNENFAAGALAPGEGFDGAGLSVVVGGQTALFGVGVAPVSGGWSRTFTLDSAMTTKVSLRYRMTFADDYEAEEFALAILDINGIRYGDGPDNSLARFTGGTGADQDTGWQLFEQDIALPAGTHTITLGAFNNRSSQATELTQVWFDDVQIGTPATPAPICGPGSGITGSEVLTFTGGSLAPGESCSFEVEVGVPLQTPTGDFLNVTSRLTTSLGDDDPKVAFPATATLRVEPIPPAFAKSFAPQAISTGGVSRLTFTIDNSASFLDATSLAFTDVLPAGVVVADPANPSSTCTGGTLGAVPGSDTVSYSGGSVAAGETCAISVDVTCATPGTYPNTSGDLTSSLGNSGSASATLTVVPPPVFTKTFGPDTLDAGQVATLTFRIDNSASVLDATGVSFTDNLPDGLVLANPVDFATDCVGGVVSASPGTSLFSYSGGIVPAGTVCELSIAVTSVEGGTYANTTSTLDSSLGSSDPASDTLEVEPVVSVTLSKTESADPVTAGSGPGNLTYVVTATNNGPSAASGVTVTEALSLPAGVALVNVTPSAGTTFADPTWNIGTLASGATATLTIVLTVDPAAQEGADVIADTATLSTVNETNNIDGGGTVTEATSIITRSDLRLTNLNTPEPIVAGSGPGNLVHLITVTNRGPSNATGVVLEESITLPPGVTIDSVLPSAGTSYDNGEWNVGALPTGAEATLEYTLTVESSAPAASEATIASVVTALDQTDPILTNNLIRISSSIVREIDPVLAVAESRDPVLAGFGLPGNLLHTVSVTNNGPSDGSDLVVDLAQALPPGVTVVRVVTPAGSGFDGAQTWTIASLPRGASAELTYELNVPATVPGGVDTISTTAVFLQANEPLTNDNDIGDGEATSVVSPLSLEIAAGEITLDLQTALFKQTVTITNNNPLGVPAFRLLVDGLPADVTVHNAQGDSGGRPYLLQNQALAPGASIDLVVEYNQVDVSGGFAPTFEIELVDTVQDAPASPGTALERVEALPNGDILLEFASTIGTSYTIQFSQDGSSWFDVVPKVLAGADRTQWIDNGPPKTPSHPSSTTSRLYRVMEQGDQ